MGAAPWTNDIIDDTCPGPSCVGNPVDYLMEPTALPPGPPLLTPGQIHVLLRNPLVNAAAPTFVRAAPLTAQPLLAAPYDRPPLRCATCHQASLR